MEDFLSVGRFHIPVYGLFAAAGLMCAMALGLRTAVLARIDRDAFWDAGMVTVLATFVLSRMLLVAEDLRTFLRYPVLVLELPSLTAGGLLLSAAVAAFYVHRRRLPLLQVLDAAAPCAALLQAFVIYGQFASGRREGMLTAVPWAIASAFGHVHPVEIYSALAWLALCGVLLWALRRSRVAGETAGWGLGMAGLLIYVMDFWRLPGVLYGTSLLTGTQARGGLYMVAGGVLLASCYALNTYRTTHARPDEAKHAF